MAKAKKSAKKSVAAKKKSTRKKSASSTKPAVKKVTKKKSSKKAARKKVVKAAKKVVKKAAKGIKKAVKKVKKVAKKVSEASPSPKKVAPKRIALKRPVIVRPAPVKKKVKLKSSAGAMQAQQKVYAEGVDLLNLRKYSQAATKFGKAAEGPNSALSHSASVYQRICKQRMASETQPKTAEDRYNAAIALINNRDLEEAGRLLGLAVKQEPKAAHIHYALAVVATLGGEVGEAVGYLSQAIEMDPQNRILALRDSDLADLRSDPTGANLLSEDEEESEEEVLVDE